MTNLMAASKDSQRGRTTAKAGASKATADVKGRAGSGGLIKKLRKPIPPPTRIAEDERKYSRARERERSQREVKDLKETEVAKSKAKGRPDDRV